MAQYPEKQWLIQNYVEAGLSLQQCADLAGIADGETIRYHLKKHDIERRNNAGKTEQPHYSEQWLIEKYHEENKSLQEMADLAGVSGASVISNQMNKHGIETRSNAEIHAIKEGKIRLGTQNGYPCFRYAGETYYTHRLCAVAWFGFDLFGDKVVHHKNDHKIDNREENLAVLTKSEHGNEHYDSHERADNGNFIS